MRLTTGTNLNVANFLPFLRSNDIRTDLLSPNDDDNDDV